MNSIQSIAQSLMTIHHRLSGRYGPLTRPQLRILTMLSKDQRTVSELAEHLNISSSGVTQALDKLQCNHYIIRKPDGCDQRVVQISITNTGLLALEEAQLQYEYRVSELLQQLTKQQQEELSCLLHHMVKDDFDQAPRQTRDSNE